MHYSLIIICMMNGTSSSNGEATEEHVTIQEAVKVLLQAMGEDPNRQGLRNTPLRVANRFKQATRGYRQKANDIITGALFPEHGLKTGMGGLGIVLVRDLDLFSSCESCLLPFPFKCHIGYVPSDDRVLGLSKLSRVADVYAKRLQHPQRLADEICAALQQGVKPMGVGVILQCSHIHFPDNLFEFDPNHEGFINMLVKSGSGVFDVERLDTWHDFLGLLRFRGGIDNEQSSDKSWCPLHAYSGPASALDPAMVDAVVSILCSLGEDPTKKELMETPTRFIKWLMDFNKSNFQDLKLNCCSNIHVDYYLNSNYLCSEVNLSFWSQCEHHLLPFYGVVHIGYYNHNDNNNVPMKSMLQSIVHYYGFKLQVQERLTMQIAETVALLLGSEDVMVVVEATHTCMISRGIEKFASRTATIAVLGRFSTDPTARAKFLQIIPHSTSGLSHQYQSNKI